MVENKPDELYGEAEPEEEVELHQTQENLILRVHGLDPTVCAKVFVDLPTELSVDLVSQHHVGAFGDRDDDRNNSGEDVDRYM